MLTLMNMVAPISALVLPAAASRATVSSWVVSPRPRPGSRRSGRVPGRLELGGPARRRPAPRCARRGSAATRRCSRASPAAPGAGAATRRRAGGSGRARRRRRSAASASSAPRSAPRPRRRPPAPGSAAATPRRPRRAVAAASSLEAVHERDGLLPSAAADRGLDEVGVLQRGDLQERVVDERPEPLERARRSAPSARSRTASAVSPEACTPPIPIARALLGEQLDLRRAARPSRPAARG